MLIDNFKLKYWDINSKASINFHFKKTQSQNIYLKMYEHE